jgi:threonylcarbamoyladenosine tRNA methylthiotransferase MtaB
MAGFPGESTTQFKNTVKLLSELPINYLHVFPFSPRPGTAAAEWKGRATGAELKRRTQELHSLSACKRQEFQNSFVGHTVEVLIEAQASPGWWQGTSGNYLHVFFPSDAALSPGSFTAVRLERFENGRLTGCMVSNPY